MKRFWICCVAVGVLGLPSWGQKIEVEKSDGGKIIHVQTALDHLTVLEMSEAVSTVAVGSRSFRVEWRENKVFIEPTEPGAATNLFVWTPSGRFNYELDPAGAVPEMVFAIDQPVPDKSKLSRNQAEGPGDPSPADILMATKPVRVLGPVSGKRHVALYITDVLERNGQILIRYSIRNETHRAYVPGAPEVVALKEPQYRESLYALRDCQLSANQSARVKSSGVTQVQVMESQMPSQRIPPGSETTGIVVVKLSARQDRPIVARLAFLREPAGPVNATLVF